MQICTHAHIRTHARTDTAYFNGVQSLGSSLIPDTSLSPMRGRRTSNPHSPKTNKVSDRDQTSVGAHSLAFV